MVQALKKFTCAVVILLLGTTPAAWGDPLPASFSYQGFLIDGGSPANGSYDFRFLVFDAADGGSQQVSDFFQEDLEVIGGLFHTELDFGNSVLQGKKLWLEIAVREAASVGSFTVLSPRQPLQAFSLNGKAANLATPLTGQVSKIAQNTTLIGSGTLFTQELSPGDALLAGGEIFTVVEILGDTQLEVAPPPATSALDLQAFRDGELLKVEAGDGQGKLRVDGAGLAVGPEGTPISRLEHGVVGDCDVAGSSGTFGTVTFSRPFTEPPRVFVTPEVTVVGCTSVRISAVSETDFGFLGAAGGSAGPCDCIFWLAIGI